LHAHRGEIIRQDAEILAMLCIAGYRKMGFSDFDDKVFDGANLHLIDVDECRDIYAELSLDYRKMLLNPSGKADLNKFRKLQKAVFQAALKDAIFMYRDSLTPTDKDKTEYIRSFYRKIGWKEPSDKEVKKLTSFPDNYQTVDGWMSMMNDTG
jgi:hypothetical protein